MVVNPADRPGSVGEFVQALWSIQPGSDAERAASKTTALPEVLDPKLAVTVAAAPVGQPDQPSAPAAAAPAGQPDQPSAHPSAPAAAAAYPVAPAAPAAEPVAETPGLPPFVEPPPKRSKKDLMPIILGIGAAMVIAGIGMGALLYLRSSPSSPGSDTPVADVSATEPVEASAASAVPPDTDQAATADADEAEDAGPDAADEGTKVAVTLRCKPACDKMLVDNEEVEDAEGKLELLPGRHTVQLFKTGYVTREETITVDEGQPYDKEFVLVPIQSGTPTKTKRKCGKFLERCD